MTLIVIMMSTISSSIPPFLNSSIIPNVHTMKITHGNIYLITVIHNFPTCNIELLFTSLIKSSIPKIHPNIMHCNAIKNNIPNWFKNPSTISTKYDDIPHVKNIEIIKPTPHNRVADFLRETLNLSHTEFNNGSKNPSAEVNPANKIAKKNNNPSMRPGMPITLKIVGNTINTNPVPCWIKLSIGTPDVTDMNPKIENTPNAVNISNPEFELTTINTLLINFAFLGK